MVEPSREGPDGLWRTTQAVALILVLGFFLYSLRAILNPFLLYWLVVALLHPFRGSRGYSLVLGVATVLALLWVLDTTGSLLAPFVLAFVLAYILDPAVEDLRDVLMIDATRRSKLLEKPLRLLGVELGERVQHLQRHGARQRLLDGGEHSTRCAGADLPEDTEFSELRRELPEGIM